MGATAGVVGDEARVNQLTTKLPVLIEFYMPYRLKTGKSLTIQFACGDNVACNCIIGIPF